MERASFDVFAVSPEGFEVHFQLAGPRVYHLSRELLEQMRLDGYTVRPMPSAPAVTVRPARRPRRR